MANAAASKKATSKKDEAPKDEKPEPKTADQRPARVSARVTITQTKTLDAQFTTTSKKVEELDKKLIEIEQKFEDKPEPAFAIAVKDARAELAKAAEAIVAGQDRFGEIRTTLEDFFG